MKSYAHIPFERYLQMETVSPSQVLTRLITMDGRQQTEIAREANIPKQRLTDLLKGTRRFTAQYSLALEKALKITIKGFFMLIQAKNDVFKYELENQRKPDLFLFRKSTFWDTDLNTIDWQKNKHDIINRIFEYGTEEEIKEIIAFYGKEEIKAALDNGKYARLPELVINRMHMYL